MDTSKRGGAMQGDIQGSTAWTGLAGLNRSRRHPSLRPATIGKAFIVYLFSGSLGIALLAFLIFKMMGW
jgi:hypothetical protein